MKMGMLAMSFPNCLIHWLFFFCLTENNLLAGVSKGKCYPSSVWCFFFFFRTRKSVSLGVLFIIMCVSICVCDCFWESAGGTFTEIVHLVLINLTLCLLLPSDKNQFLIRAMCVPNLHKLPPLGFRCLWESLGHYW